MATLLAADLTQSLSQRATTAGVFVKRLAADRGSDEDALLTAGMCADSALVLDGYCFDRRYQEVVRAAAKRLLVIDDVAGEREFHCDLLLNQNIHAVEAEYRTLAGADCRFLLGPRYALLPQGLQDLRAERIHSAAVPGSILISLGGGDSTAPVEFLLDVLADAGCKAWHVTVLAGASDAGKLRDTAVSLQLQAEIVSGFVDDLPSRLAQADMAIIAGGVTSWEALCIGVPTVILAIADNQVPSSRVLGQTGAAMFLGMFGEFDRSSASAKIAELARDRRRRQEMSAKANELVDGSGAGRVAGELKGIKPRH